LRTSWVWLGPQRAALAFVKQERPPFRAAAIVGRVV